MNQHYNQHNHLPDELVEHIFGFAIEFPKDVFLYSRVSKQWNEILNNDDENSSSRIWKHVNLTNGGGGDGNLLSTLRKGFRWNEFYCHPFQHVVETLYGFIQRLRGGYSADSNNGKSLLYEIKEKVNRREFSKWIQYSNQDEKLKNYLKLGFALSNGVLHYFPIIVLTLLSIISIDIMISVGFMSQLDESERSLKSGLWWLPYTFIPFNVIFYMGLVSLCSGSIIAFLYFWRKFIINKRVYEKYDRNFRRATDFALVYFTIFIGLEVYYWIVYGISSIFMEWAGETLSPTHSFINSIIYGIFILVLFVGFLYYGYYLVASSGSSFKIPFFIVSSLLLYLLSSGGYVSFGFGENVYCLLPLSILYTGGSIADILVDASESSKQHSGFSLWATLGVGLSAIMICLRYYSFFTMVPLTISVLLLTIEEWINLSRYIVVRPPTRKRKAD